MKFGTVVNPDNFDFILPKDHPETKRVLEKFDNKLKPEVYVGCAKWNKADLKGFYPRGTKDELTYYASQFNSVELNATFYRIFSSEQFESWRNKTPEGFKFFPKLNQEISHRKRLNDVTEIVNTYLYNASNLQARLGTIFLQMHNNFAPKEYNRVVDCVEAWPKEAPLAIEFRHSDCYNDGSVSNELYEHLEAHNVSNIIVDTAGRRDLLHMRMTNGTAFVRYVGANDKSDYERLDDWVERLYQWQQQGINEIDFFVHQNIEKESPLLSAYFIEKLNEKLNINLTIPQTTV